MRIRVEKKLPKLEAAITEMVTAWEKENEATLVFDGEPFLVRTIFLMLLLLLCYSNAMQCNAGGACVRA